MTLGFSGWLGFDVFFFSVFPFFSLWVIWRGESLEHTFILGIPILDLHVGNILSCLLADFENQAIELTIQNAKTRHKP
jgi:hypothetical protein